VNNIPVITVVESKESNSPPEEVLQQIAEKDIETASAISGNVAMECEEFRATKRKKSHSTERQSSEESEDEILKRVKVSRRQRIFGKDTSYLNKEQSRSNPDLLSRPPEEDPRIIKMKKGYISKQRLEIEEAKEEIVEKKREEARKKKEDKAKIEAKIMAKINTKLINEREKDYINNMAASELAAMALEYLDHVEIIRTKCGTMQGALSGELKRRKLSLDNMIRALQAKAEESGDPLFLRAKIDELLKKMKGGKGR